MRDASARRAEIARIFRERLDIEVPSEETDLIDGGYLDSLAFVELLVELERDYGIEIAGDALDIDNFRSVADIADFVLTQRELRRVV